MERERQYQGVRGYLRRAWLAWTYRPVEKTDDEIVVMFRAGLWGTEASRRVMYELAKRWHFYDPYLEDETARQKRRCFMELLILSGKWHPDGLEEMFRALTTEDLKPGCARRMFSALGSVYGRITKHG